MQYYFNTLVALACLIGVPTLAVRDADSLRADTLVNRIGNVTGVSPRYHDTSLEHITLIDKNIDNAVFDHMRFEDCTLRYRSYISGLSMDSVVFLRCSIPEMSFSRGNFSRVDFINCEIGIIEFNDVNQLRNIAFKNCKIKDIRLLRTTITNLTFESCSCPRLSVEECKSVGIRFSLASIKKVIIRRGSLRRFDVMDTGPDSTLILLEHVELQSPGFSPELATVTDFRKARIPNDFFLLQDFEAEHLLGSKSLQQEARFDAMSIYAILRNQYREAGAQRTEIRMEYLLREAERRSLPSRWQQLWRFAWDAQLRGHYGTSPSVVLRSACWIWLLFASFYLLLGKLRVAWGAAIDVTVLGEVIRNEKPRVIVRRPGLGQWQFLVACLSFSVDNLLVVGIRQGLGASQFTEQIAKIPRRFVGIGIGRVVASAESLIGLILIYSFVQAFIHTI